MEGQYFTMMQIESKLKLEFFPDLNGKCDLHLPGLSSIFSFFIGNKTVQRSSLK